MKITERTVQEISLDENDLENKRIIFTLKCLRCTSNTQVYDIRDLINGESCCQYCSNKDTNLLIPVGLDIKQF
jgi:hypothetical protein